MTGSVSPSGLQMRPRAPIFKHAPVNTYAAGMLEAVQLRCELGMPKSFKPTVLSVLALSAVFTFFFFLSKHNPLFSDVNAFAEDPYDAIGSFGFQLALFAALLSVIRVFLPRGSGELSASQKLLVIRGCTVSVQAVAVTLAAEMVAMFRSPSLWMDSPRGRLFALLVAVMTWLAAFVAWRIDRLAYNAGLKSEASARRMALVNSLAGIAILAIYPSAWRETVTGAILTALLGMALLFLLTWSLAAALSPRIDIHDEDFLDELGASYRWLRTRLHALYGTLGAVEKFLSTSLLRSFLKFLNPHRHKWNLAVLVALIVGIILALVELGGESIPGEGALSIIVATYVGIETVGVLVGYGLFTRYLGIFRTGK